MHHQCRLCWWKQIAAAVLMIGASIQAAWADEPVEAPAPGSIGDSREDVAALAEKIDRLVASRLNEEDIVPAGLSGDAEFLRRVYLDIAGRIPPVSKVREFLADRSPEKRRKIVDELLAGNSYVNHFTTLWRRVMLPEADSTSQARYMVPGFEAWLRAKLKQNVGYDDLVRELVTTPLNGSQNIYSFQNGMLTPVAFFRAKETKPENLAAATSRIFLGIRLECAQCHDHPFGNWEREQFWSFAAFYSNIQPQRPRQTGVISAIRKLLGAETARPKGLRIPETNTYVTAAFLDDGKKAGGGNPRESLAVWLTSPRNPYFARTAVNRMWGHFFGIGLVDPVDDFNESNPPSHPRLLDELARDFADHQFDLKYIIRAITASRTYQLSSALTDESQTREPRLFARMAVKGLTAEQLFDSLAQATGYRKLERNPNPFAFNANSPRQKFLDLFHNASDEPVKRQTTILQALSMMNGQLVANATNLQNSQTLAAVTDYPLMSNAERIDALYLAALSRSPRPEETARMVQYVEANPKAPQQKRALSDVFWALLNSSEFMLNH